MPSFAGLSDMGFLQPTQSNKSDDISKTDTLAQLLENSSALYDELGRARVLEQQYDKLSAQETPSTLDRLLSPEGIIRLLGTAGAGAIGGAPAAAGFGLGSVGALNSAAEADRAQKRKAMEELNDRHEKVLDRLDKSRNRYTTLLQSQPELFLDPETGQPTVSPKLLGIMATGDPVPLSPAAKSAIKSAGENDERRYNLLNERLTTAPDVESRKTILKSMFNILKSDVPEGELNALASAKPEESNKMTADFIAKYYPAVATDVFIAASELGVPYSDYRITRMLKGHYKDPDLDDDAGKLTIPDLAIQAGGRIAAWQKDPENAETLRKLKSEAITEMDFSLKLATEVLGGDRDQYDAYRTAFKLVDPKDLQMTTEFYGDVVEGNATADAFAGFEDVESRRAMTPEERRAADWKVAQDQVKAAKQAVKTEQANLDLETATSIIPRLQAIGMPRMFAQHLAVKFMKDAKNAATRPNGTVDRERYIQEVNTAVENHLADNTPAQ